MHVQIFSAVVHEVLCSFRGRLCAMALATRVFSITCLGETKPFEAVVDRRARRAWGEQLKAVVELFPVCGAQGEYNAPRAL